MHLFTLIILSVGLLITFCTVLTILSSLLQFLYFPHFRFRTITGICNNLYYPSWGQAKNLQLRMLEATYEDGFGLPRGKTVAA